MSALNGVHVVEIAGKGPGPFAAMLLADLGADVLRIDPPVSRNIATYDPSVDIFNRGRRSAIVDLKRDEGREVVLRLTQRADALIEGLRPGVMERLGLGPSDCHARNPRLVYGRITGWGQEGPLAQVAGHDINFIALSGVLHTIGSHDGPPVAPLNLVGDFGGGGMLLAIGILCGLLEAQRSGRGQVVDAAMVDGSALLSTIVHMLRASGQWEGTRESNLLDGGAPYYAVYETSDARYVTVGAIEQQFYRELLERIGYPDVEGAMAKRHDRATWPETKRSLAAIFRTRTRDEWTVLLEGTETCFAPVLTPAEAIEHPHLVSRGTFVEPDGVVQPAPAPRLGVTPGSISRAPPLPGQHTHEALRDWGLPDTEIEGLLASGALRETQVAGAG